MNSIIVISDSAPEALVEYFEFKGFNVILFEKMDKPHEAVSNHPDMFMFYDDILFLEKDVTQSLSENAVKSELIGNEYPSDIKYNICKVGNKIICKYEYISSDIIKHFKERKYKILNVNQGYAKCSTCIVDDDSIITADKSISKICIDNDIDVLLIEPGHIILKKFNYGFIGGASVMFDDIVFFNGDITEHPDYDAINSFIKSKNKKIEYMNYPLEDLGSFIIINK